MGVEGPSDRTGHHTCVSVSRILLVRNSVESEDLNGLPRPVQEGSPFPNGGDDSYS